MLTRIICSNAVALAVLGLCVACGTLSERAIRSSSPAEVCRVHHVSLVTVDAFTPRAGVIVDPGIVEAKALKRYPHFISSGYSLRRTADYPVLTKLTYCPRCEEAVRAIPGLKRI